MVELTRDQESAAVTLPPVPAPARAVTIDDARRDILQELERRIEALQDVLRRSAPVPIASAAAPQQSSNAEGQPQPQERSLLAREQRRQDAAPLLIASTAVTAQQPSNAEGQPQPRERPLPAREQRRRAAIFPAPVPRYQPPRWTKEEVDAVKRRLF